MFGQHQRSRLPQGASQAGADQQAGADDTYGQPDTGAEGCRNKFAGGDGQQQQQPQLACQRQLQRVVADTKDLRYCHCHCARECARQRKAHGNVPGRQFGCQPAEVDEQGDGYTTADSQKNDIGDFPEGVQVNRRHGKHRGAASEVAADGRG